MRFSVLVLCAILATAAPQAQTPQPPPQQPQVFRGGIDLLTVDVTVLDADGKQLTDLKPSDFIVEVDGKARPVVTAEYVKMVDDTPIPVGARRAAVPAKSPDEEFFSTNTRSLQRGRLILLLVDQGNIRAGMGRQVMRDAVKFVDGLAPADRVAVVAIPGPGALVDFTTEHEKVREALLTIVGLRQPFKGKFNISMSEAMATVEHSDQQMTQQMLQRECGSIMLTAVDQARCELEVEQECSEIMAHQRHETDASLRGMREVLRSLAALEGPKSVILISEGLILEGLGTEVDELASLAADVRASLDIMLMDVPPIDVAESRRPTTPREDRDLQTRGLENLAGIARGGLHRIVSSSDYAFNRIMRSIAGYYLLGVESTPVDRDGKRHRIQVKSARKGVRVHSRRGFLAPTSPAASSPAEAVKRALGAPLTMNELTMKMATWTYKEPGGSRVRLLIAAEIERATDQSSDYTTGLVVVDRNNKVIAGAVEAKKLAVSESDPGVALFTGSLLVEPGTYLIRVAVADSEGRMGSVDRKLDAWQMTGPGLSVGDLLVAGVPTNNGTIMPAVEPRIANGLLTALIEVYGSSSSALENLQATLEVLPGPDAKPIATTAMRAGTGASPEIGALQANLSTAALPPGRYLARATVTQAGKPFGHFVRPFRVVSGEAAAGAAVAGTYTPTVLPSELLGELLAGLPNIDSQALLKADVMSSVLAATEMSRPGPAAKTALATARAGRMGPAALAALDGGDQLLAAFLRGVDFFAQGQIERAMQQLQIAMQQAPTFAPARLFLGAALAQTNKHREAASLLSSVPPEVAGAAVSQLAALSWLKAGDSGFAIQALEKAAAQSPGNLEIARMLGVTYVVGNRPADALPVLTRYLDAKPDDQGALLAGIYCLFATRGAGSQPGTLATDRARAQTWAKAYAASGGTMQPLVQAWITHLEGLK